MKTHNEVSGLIGAGKESGRVGVHLVPESGGSAVLCLPAEGVPEFICETT